MSFAVDINAITEENEEREDRESKPDLHKVVSRAYAKPENMAQSQAKIKKLFCDIDNDSSGKLTKSNLKSWFEENDMENEVDLTFVEVFDEISQGRAH